MISEHLVCWTELAKALLWTKCVDDHSCILISAEETSLIVH